MEGSLSGVARSSRSWTGNRIATIFIFGASMYDDRDRDSEVSCYDQ